MFVTSIHKNTAEHILLSGTMRWKYKLVDPHVLGGYMLLHGPNPILALMNMNLFLMDFLYVFHVFRRAASYFASFPTSYKDIRTDLANRINIFQAFKQGFAFLIGKEMA